MKKKIHYSDEFLGDDIKVVRDFLPPPSSFVLKKEDEEIAQQKRVNFNFPVWMLQSIDKEACRLGVSRQSLVKFWLSEKLHPQISS
ncbi:MAG: hypothetical protein WCL34_03105 [Methylococcaceae bacterium]|jgi:hypothetical protein